MAEEEFVIPDEIEVDITDEVYEATKKRILEEAPVGIRGALKFFFKWVRELKPDEVREAIEKDITIAEKLKSKHPKVLAARMTLAGARGFLKSRLGREYRALADEYINVGLGYMILRHENPEVYEIIVQNDGDDWFKRNIKELREKLGL